MKNIYAFILLISIQGLFAQNYGLKTLSFLQYPKDSTVKQQLNHSLSEFLRAANQPNESNVWVYTAQRIETYILLDEINGQTFNIKFKKDSFFEPQLINVSPLNDSIYRLQIAYINKSQAQPIVRSAFDLLAHRSKDTFLFSSPLLYNTQSWSTTVVDNIILHHQSGISKDKLKEYLKYKNSYDDRLATVPGSTIKKIITEYYCFRDLYEMQNCLGIAYKFEFIGRTKSVLISHFNHRKLMLLGNNNSDFSHIDSHDLWHERLGLITPRNLINHSVDEGCAYLYGGSWGLSWKDIFTVFNKHVASNPDTNWLDMKVNQRFFMTGEFYNNPEYIVTALLIKKVEKKYGFAGVWEMMKAKETEEYFQVLEKFLGVTKVSYNAYVFTLIDEERKSLGIKV